MNAYVVKNARISEIWFRSLPNSSRMDATAKSRQAERIKTLLMKEKTFYDMEIGRCAA